MQTESPNTAPLDTVQAARPLTRAMLAGVALFSIALSPGLALAYQFRHAGWFYAFLSVILLFETWLAWASIRLARLGSANAQRWAAWGGAALIAGGIGLDVLSTILKDPQLNIEGNIVIRFLYDQGAPLWGLYLLGFYAQAVLVILSVAFWVAFLRHAATYQSALLALRPQFLLEFLWAAFGGNTFWGKQERLRVSRSYRLLWLPVLISIAPLSRWWLGFEWLGLVPLCAPLRAWVFNGENALIALSFLGWLVWMYARNRAALHIPAADARRKSVRALIRSLAVGGVLFTCACCALTAAAIPTLAYLSRPPDGLQAQLTVTERAKTGEAVIAELSLTNTSNRPITITHIGLRLPGFPSLTEGATYVLSVPETEYRVIDQSEVLLVMHTLQPGEQARWQIWMYAVRPGRYTAFLPVFNYFRTLVLQTELTIEDTQP